MSSSHLCTSPHVLGIESSCDDTGVAIVGRNGKILSNCIHSPLKEHLTLGGIIPVIAKEFHLMNIDKVANKAFQESKLQSIASDIDAIAVTTRPGLDFSLKVGLNYAKRLVKKYSKPLIPIHHMQAHALMPLLENRSIKFPFMALLVSGGHCLLSIAKRYNEFELLGESRDDAPGDVLDKIARRLKLRNLGPPFDRISGGAAIELLSRREDADRFKYFASSDGNYPMAQHQDCTFSFSAYRSMFDKFVPVIDTLWARGDRDVLQQELGHVCASLQRVMLIQIAKRLQRAIMYYRMFWKYENEAVFASDGDTSHLGFELRKLVEEDDSCIDVVVSGGVAANKYLVDGIRLACEKGFETNNRVFAPSKALCSDNGLMIAWNGMLKYQDYLDRGDQHYSSNQTNLNCDIHQSVIVDSSQMDLLDRQATCPIGRDISESIRMKSMKLQKLNHPEFKIKR